MTGQPGEPLRTVRCYISGRVQGVCYRANAAAHARALGLQGYVRNRRDGRVEILIGGDARAVTTMIGWLWQGPAQAEVTGVAVEIASESELAAGFSIAETA